MKKTFLLKTMLLLCALIVGSASVWADYEAVYTLDGTITGGTNAYAEASAITQNEMNWSVVGNTTQNPWRIGGKSLDGVNRDITGEDKFTEALTKITFNHAGTTSDALIVNSITLTVASDADFTDVIDEVSKTSLSISKNTNGSIEFVPTSPSTEWAKDSYYKFTINLTNEKNSNYGFCPTSIVFYKTVASKIDTETEINTVSLTNSDLKNGTAAGSLSASVTAGGSAVAGATVTWESGDTDVATIDEDGVVTLVGVGTTTITATYAGDATYYGSSDTYDLTVTDTRIATVTTIDDAGLTNTDVFTSSTAGQLTASVTAGGSAVAAAIVTWESSDPTVATVDAAGNITLLKVGTTTITASYAGGADYTASADTYELTVTDSNAPLLSESVSLYTSDSDSSTKITNDNKATYLDDADKWAAGSFDNAYPGRKFDGRENGCFKLGTSSKTGTIKTNSISLIGCGKLTFQAKQYKDGENGLTVSVDGATASGDVSVTAGSDFKEYTVYLNDADGDVVITFATPSKRIYLDDIKLVKVEKDNIVITSAGWATINTAYPLDFTGSGVKAYIVTNTTANSVVLEEVKKVPDNTAILVNGTTNEIPVTTDATDDVSSNKLEVSDGTIVGNGSIYVLAKKDAVGFYKLANDVTIPAGKCYLDTAASAPEFLGFSFGEETTGISQIENGKLRIENVYNLNGQRVAQPSKGLYIMNGRKVVIK